MGREMSMGRTFTIGWSAALKLYNIYTWLKKTTWHKLLGIGKVFPASIMTFPKMIDLFVICCRLSRTLAEGLCLPAPGLN